MTDTEITTVHVTAALGATVRAVEAFAVEIDGKAPEWWPKPEVWLNLFESFLELARHHDYTNAISQEWSD